MKYDCKKIGLEQTGAFPSLLLDYLNESNTLKAFYNQYPSLENFETLIQERKFGKKNRETLYSVLKEQYSNLGEPSSLSLLLEDNTFTVTTGHQLNIFTGPLYIIYKIVSTINLARRLKEAYPAYNFVPIYWMATEDHDLDEIQSARIFGKKVTWQTNQTGAVGRMSTEGLADLAAQLGSSAQLFLEAYKGNENLSDAVRAYMHELFGEEGLITIDADHRELKKLFRDVMLQDILENKSENFVSTRSEELQQLGYKTPVYPRTINFFYLEEGIRERIERTADTFQVVDTDITFSPAQIKNIIENEPEKLSPNVVLRPLYQETILPNLAYFGGPSEVPYWLQLKSVFDYHKVDFPALIPRNFGLVLTPKYEALRQKLELAYESLFAEIHKLQAAWVETNSHQELDIKSSKAAIAAKFEAIAKQIKTIDATLVNTTEAFGQKTAKLLESLEKKIIRAEKRNHHDAMRQIEKLKNFTHPQGGLQERKDNFLNFYAEDKGFIKALLEVFDPLDFRMNVMVQKIIVK